jgi:hypothetical protein
MIRIAATMQASYDDNLFFGDNVNQVKAKPSNERAPPILEHALILKGIASD